MLAEKLRGWKLRFHDCPECRSKRAVLVEFDKADGRVLAEFPARQPGLHLGAAEPGSGDLDGGVALDARTIPGTGHDDLSGFVEAIGRRSVDVIQLPEA